MRSRGWTGKRTRRPTFRKALTSRRWPEELTWLYPPFLADSRGKGATGKQVRTHLPGGKRVVEKGLAGLIVCYPAREITRLHPMVLDAAVGCCIAAGPIEPFADMIFSGRFSAYSHFTPNIAYAESISLVFHCAAAAAAPLSHIWCGIGQGRCAFLPSYRCGSLTARQQRDAVQNFIPAVPIFRWA